MLQKSSQGQRRCQSPAQQGENLELLPRLRDSLFCRQVLQRGACRTSGVSLTCLGTLLLQPGAVFQVVTGMCASQAPLRHTGTDPRQCSCSPDSASTQSSGAVRWPHPGPKWFDRQPGVWADAGQGRTLGDHRSESYGATIYWPSQIF